MQVVLVVGARPNFMKVAPLHAALARRPGVQPLLVHTGQHYDAALSGLFFEQLGLPQPAVNFGVGSGTHARQTAEVMAAFETWLAGDGRGTDVVVVVGDVNSTVACALVAAKAGVRLAHVEAGLRSFDRSMPEEVNRVVVDALADLHFVTEPSGVLNLRREGIAGDRVHLVGNVMIDSLLAHREAARASTVLATLGMPGGTHAAVTIHRPSNVDRREDLEPLLDALAEVARILPVVLPLHPRTRASARALGLESRLAAPGLHVTEPLPYLDFVQLMATARLVVTDSGGIQEETTILGVPCLTVRDSTERPVTVEEGTNRVIGRDPARILPAAREALEAGRPGARTPHLWDGLAAERIADVLVAERRP